MRGHVLNTETGANNNSRPRLLYATKNRTRGGGQEKHVFQLARRFHEKYEIVFLVAGGYIEPELPGMGRIYRFPGRGKWVFAPVDALYMLYVIIKEDIDLIHTHHRYPGFLGRIISCATRPRLLSTVHNRFPDKSGISLWGDKVIAVSRSVSTWLTDQCGVSAERIEVIYNGIGTPMVYSQDELNELRRSLGVDGKDVVLCAVGRITEQKNYPGLLETLARLRNRQWILLLVGEGELRAETEKLVMDYRLGDRVQFLGYRDDVSKIMQLSDIYVMSSAWEGFPYVIVEALANRLPVIATDVGGVPEAVRHGENGYIVPPGNTDEMARYIGMLIDDVKQRQLLGSAGRRMFEEMFTDEVMYERVENEYNKLLRAGR